MMLRARRGCSYAGATYRKEPLNDFLAISETARVMKEGSSAEKIGAIADLSVKMQDGGIPKEETMLILETALRDSHPMVRKNAAFTFLIHGKDMLLGLCSGLGNDDPQLRNFSAVVVNSIISSDETICSSDCEENRQIVRLLITSLAEPKISGKVEEVLRHVASRSPFMVIDEISRFGSFESDKLKRIERAATDSVERIARNNQA